ncbi:MAG: zinc ribbon domain-containing protein [Acidobacteriaceae bacterium]|nr:zinc ribbon domain-containing protein [Acidobacteriaceae bacterium]
MPLYEYQCEKCGDSFEVMQKFSDEPLSAHEKCGGPVHRLLSAPALQFKGSGWYITDYAKSGGSKPNGSPAKSESKSSGESTTTSSASETKASPSESK